MILNHLDQHFIFTAVQVLDDKQLEKKQKNFKGYAEGKLVANNGN